MTLSGKVCWSFNLPEMAASLNNHFLLAQLRNLKRAVVAKGGRTLSPASAPTPLITQGWETLGNKSHSDSLERQAGATFYCSLQSVTIIRTCTSLTAGQLNGQTMPALQVLADTCFAAIMQKQAARTDNNLNRCSQNRSLGLLL